MIKYFINKLLSRRYISSYVIGINSSQLPSSFPLICVCHLSIPTHKILDEGPARSVHGKDRHSQSEGRLQSCTRKDSHCPIHGRMLTVASMVRRGLVVPCMGSMIVVSCMGWKNNRVPNDAHGSVHGKEAHGLVHGKQVHAPVHEKDAHITAHGKDTHGPKDAHISVYRTEQREHARAREGGSRSRAQKWCSQSRAWEGSTLMVRRILTVPCMGRRLTVPFKEGTNNHGPVHWKDAQSPMHGKEGCPRSRAWEGVYWYREWEGGSR